MADGWTTKRSRGKKKADEYEKVKKNLEAAIAASTRAENTHGSLGDRGFAVDTSRDILDDRDAVVPAWSN
eukprot:6123218-Heterocapsa_arctica.AAC.1